MSASDVIALLQEQYQCTEDYCNASTALHNALLQEDGPWVAVSRHQEALGRLQRIVHKVEEMLVMFEDVKTKNEEESTFLRLWNVAIFREHWECTRRILGTIYRSCEGTSYDRYGLPQMKNSFSSEEGAVHIQLVALATLRASIQQVRESLPPDS